MACVAAIDAHTKRGAELDREDAGLLREPRKAAVRVDDAGCWNGVSRATIEAFFAATAAVRDRGFCRDQHGRCDDGAKHKIGALAGDEKVCVFAEPANTCLIRSFPVNEGIVISEHNGLKAGSTKMMGHCPQPVP